jgi:uncharacterized protein involved in exopolysaccharide biosynthesis
MLRSILTFPFRLLIRSRPHSARIFRGGRLNDFWRLPRYFLLVGCIAAGIWMPISAYVRFTPPSYTSDVSLILPGSGAQSSVNLADLGQASSSAASAFSSSRISPTQTYKRLLAANRTLERTADDLGIDMAHLGEPQIRLVDETSLIHFSMVGPSPEAAQASADALLAAFLDEIAILRQDELRHREESSQSAIAEYEQAVDDLRVEIATLQAESNLVSFAHYEELVRERDALASKFDTEHARRLATDAQMLALSAQLGVSPELAAANLRLHADPEFQHLAQSLSEQSAVLAEAQGRFGPRHPKVTGAAQKVSGTEVELNRRSGFILGDQAMVHTARFDLSSTSARAGLMADLVELATLCESYAKTERTIEAQLKTMDARLAVLAPQASRLDDLSRDYQVAEAVFTSALARVDTTKSDIYASYPLVQVLADASLPKEPTSPKELIAIAAGIVATFMVLIGLLLAWVRRPLIDKLLTRDAA